MKIVIDNVFWWKVSFIFIVFFEAFLSGLIPTWSKSCRENPKILGNANAFAAGVFLAIAFVHILPEMAGNWNELMATKGVDKPFPLPYFLLFLGYTLILIIDKVMFDTHSIFEGDSYKHDDNVDPAEIKLVNNVRASMVQLQAAQKSEVPSMLKRS